MALVYFLNWMKNIHIHYDNFLDEVKQQIHNIKRTHSHSSVAMGDDGGARGEQ